VSLDLPGHGVRAGEPFTFEAAAAAVAEAIDAAVPSGRAVVVGLSLGGYVAIEAAERYPDRVAGLVLAGCTAEPRGGPGAVIRAAALAFERVSHGVLEAVNIAIFRVRYPRSIADPIIAGGFWWEGGAVALRALLERRFLDRLSRMWVPLLVVNGAFDFVFAPGGEAWADAARQGRSVVVRWAGHLVPMDRPATFAAHVATFTRSVAATPGPASGQESRPDG
jgi:pimeloyl-ACP methyl ester carboxylesterase